MTILSSLELIFPSQLIIRISQKTMEQIIGYYYLRELAGVQVALVVLIELQESQLMS
jgi:hypothetical protein